jgi:hypothetical protein
MLLRYTYLDYNFIKKINIPKHLFLDDWGYYKLINTIFFNLYLSIHKNSKASFQLKNISISKLQAFYYIFKFISSNFEISKHIKTSTSW